MYEPYRFARPLDLTLVTRPKLSVAVVIACRDGQEKLDLVLASLVAQTYPASLMSVYVIDDGSAKPLTLPEVKPAKTTLISYKNTPGKWGKTAATNDCVAKLRQDVLWFVDADMVFEPDHLAHHMKWHHDNDDYAVLGWKRFVKNWSYNPEALVTALKAGAFDLLHAGHILMLKEAKSVCDHLIVALQINPTLDRPDKNKPIQSFYERWTQLSSVKYVDEIIPYETEKELMTILQNNNIDIRILGDEYRNKVFTGCNLEMEYFFNKRTHKYSSTELRKRLGSI
jgi:cytidyltransferase-like protein